MTAREYLNRAYWLNQRINSLLEQISSLNEIATRTTAVLREDVVSGGRDVQKGQDVIAGIIDLKNEVNAEIDRLVDLKREITEVIRGVEDPRYQLLLELRYLCFMDWSEIADRMRCGENNIYKLHTKALRTVRVPENRTEQDG